MSSTEAGLLVDQKVSKYYCLIERPTYLVMLALQTTWLFPSKAQMNRRI